MFLLEEDAVKRIIWQKNETDVINEVTQKAKFTTRGEIKSRRSQKKKPASSVTNGNVPLRPREWSVSSGGVHIGQSIFFHPAVYVSRKPSAYRRSRCVSVAPEKISFMRKLWGFISQASLFLCGNKRPPVMWSQSVRQAPLVAGCRIGHKSFLLCVELVIYSLLESHHNIL